MIRCCSAGEVSVWKVFALVLSAGGYYGKGGSGRVRVNIVHGPVPAPANSDIVKCKLA